MNANVEGLCDAASEDTDYLLVQVRRRDLVEVLVQKYKHPIINFAGQLLGDWIEAQDVAQSAFVQVFRRAVHFRSECRFSTWLFTVAGNLCHNEHRRRALYGTELVGSIDSEWSITCGPGLESFEHTQASEAVFEQELHQKIEESLASLPEKQRIAIGLIRDRDLSCEQVAKILGTTAMATKSDTSRAPALKRHLQPYLRTGAWAAKPQRNGGRW